MNWRQLAGVVLYLDERQLLAGQFSAEYSVRVARMVEICPEVDLKGTGGIALSLKFRQEQTRVTSTKRARRSRIRMHLPQCATGTWETFAARIYL